MSIFDPHSDAARSITALWWWMLLAATVVFVGAIGLLLAAYLRRDHEGLPAAGESPPVNRGLVVIFGIVIPLVAVIAVFSIANFAVAAKTDAPAPTPDTVAIDVTGRQWWWDVRYPEAAGAVTANEIHIPVGTPVDVAVKSADVIHSFWVPQLNRKIDMIPGETNHVELRADRPGRYEGQCAEYCGVQHAHMRLVVIAQPRADYDAWVRSAAADAAPPQTAAQRRGERTFEANACAGCHQIRGTSAQGRVGPDLTHLQERATLAALTIPNTPGYLARWIRDPQHIKPGNRMPGLNLSDAQYSDLTAYLEGLK